MSHVSICRFPTGDTSRLDIDRIAGEILSHIASLALASHASGPGVFATAHNPSKLAQCPSAGIETMTLDVLSTGSINTAVSKPPSLDILINNTGSEYLMPGADVDIADEEGCSA
ncbi:hypothetical protein MPDQ_001545 [Monascus purpureus]|uniref:Uncharacterized protein n=1 Tax=Monascus purpureus TaxID=5098 RepID=A0A507QRP5_MONPU|nr:hypothetical protein MPDQ_001545 [Monascus purpureus]